ncbi:hypothetical protein GDO86_020218 [Hymenochirus boettgeri]|uniref:Uncharacterized protein n=1 Tax=Hymenochirus boettgeri TaxID=247094 RepID=A0A8T2I8B3_9PIPI|nr:hypothetical protein GDO86_020218 [Hymenochirus boettgeri]
MLMIPKFTCPPLHILVQSQISKCLHSISSWMAHRRLKLNLTKTELIIPPLNWDLVHPSPSLLRCNILCNIAKIRPFLSPLLKCSSMPL